MSTTREPPKPILAPAPPTTPRVPQQTVSGTVIDALTTAPLPKLTVRAFDKELRTETALGEAVTDARGFYSITYTKRAADLFIRVLDATGNLLVTSPVVFAARATETIDVRYVDPKGRVPTEHDRHVTTLTPLLRGVDLAALTDDEIAFAARKTGMPPLFVGYLAIAHRLAAATKLAPDVLYGLLRAGLPSRISALLLQPTTRIRKAIAWAQARNVITPMTDRDISALLAALRSLIANQVLATTANDGFSLQPLLAASGVSVAQQAEFLSRYLDQDGSDTDFWNTLAADKAFGEAAVASLEFALQAGILAGDDLALANTLIARRANGQIKSAQDLLAYKVEDWTKAGATVASAQALRDTLREAFPTLAVGLSLAATARLDAATRADVSKLFANVPDLELIDTRVHAYLDSNPNALAGVANRAALEAELVRVQRVFRVAKTPEHVEALLVAGLDSAYAIAITPVDAFVASFGSALGGDVQARAYHSNASSIAATNSVVGSWAQQAIHGYGPAAVGGPGMNILKQVPSLETLFGAMDSCNCEECRSVYGPASYLVDVLQFLRKGGDGPYNRLIARRPDLEWIELTCENSETPLPLIDLANEILEFYVVHGDFAALSAADKQALAKNTADATANELALNPQFTDAAAYAKLAQAVRAPSLPFDRDAETVSAYLGLLGSKRAELLATLQSVGVPVDPAQPQGPIDRTQHSPSDTAIAFESLRLTALATSILDGTSASTVADLFGISIADATWRTKIATAEILIRHLGCSYLDLVALLQTRYINQSLAGLPGKLIVAYAVDATCDLSKTYIQYTDSDPAHLDATGLSDTDWLRIQKFVRLRRALGWSTPDLDQALVVLSAPGAIEITDLVLERLADAEQLRVALDLQPVDLLALWGALQIYGAPSLYASLFQNKAVLNPPDETFALVAGVMSHDGAPLDGHEPALLAALRISATDLARLCTATGISTLTLANLSTLYRHAVLARALAISIMDLLDVRALTEIDPFIDPRATRDFTAAAETITATDFTIEQLAFLFFGTTRPDSRLAPETSSVLSVLLQLQDSLRAIVEQTQPSADPNGDVLRSKLVMLLDHTRLDTAIAVIENTSTLAPADQNTFIAASLVFLDPADAAAKLVDPGALASVEDRRAYVLPLLLAHLRASQSRGTVIQTLADSLAIDGQLVSLLVERTLPSQLDPAAFAIDDFRNLVGDGLSAKYFSQTSGFDDSTPSLLERRDPEIDFYWDTAAPAPAVPTTFGARWRGHVVAEHDETYTFYVRAVTGARLYVWPDGDPMPTPLIDAWTNSLEHAATLVMEAERAYAIVVDYHAEGPGASIELSWSSLSTQRAIIPESQLFSANFSPPSSLVPSYLLLHRIAMLATGFGMSADEVAYFTTHSADFGGLDLAHLGATAHPWGAWSALATYFALRSKVPSSNATLLAVFAATDRTAACTQLATLTGFALSDVTTLAQQLELRDPDLRNATGPTRIRDGIMLAQRLGVPVTRLIAWATTPPDGDQAGDVIRTAKSRYDDQTWLTAAKPVSDDLRDRRRDALVALILSDPALPSYVVDSDSLFELFLIDVNMDACMMTSRIKQAMSSVQLFIQRCFMNLESPQVAPSQLDANRWLWMKNYRVWEANRKVFLYPENWIEPSLRHDKTPFFIELEALLQQNPLTKDSAEDALVEYLRKLDDVARLEICGLCRQTAEPGEAGDILHVFGRTANAPHSYYYRKFFLATETWTAWEHVPLDIDGDHLVPAFFHRRLYLFWPTFEQKPDPFQDLSGAATDTSAMENWKLTNASYQGADQEWQAANAGYIKAFRGLAAAFQLDDQDYYVKNFPGPLSAYVAEPTAPGDPPPDPAPVTGPKPRWEISLSWSEHRDDAWSNKRKSATPLLSYSHFDDSTSRPPRPSIADHVFQVETSQTSLGIDVYRRQPAFAGDSFDEGVSHVGAFGLDDCHAKLVTLQLDYSELDPDGPSFPMVPTQLRTPEHSHYVYMGFDEEPGETTLTFQGADFKAHELLAATPTPFHVLQPAENYLPLGSQVYYPFAYRDQQRIYVADVVHGPVKSSLVKYRPPIDVHYQAEDPTITNIKKVDPGDPGPNLVVGNGIVAKFGAATNRDGIEARKLILGDAATSPTMTPPSSNTHVVARLVDYVRFHTADHPHVCEFLEVLDRAGIAALLDRSNQVLTRDTPENLFHKSYKPTSIVDTLYPRTDVDFRTGAYSTYNWELFFHIPLLIAEALSNDQQFEEAQRWFHFIFDPTASQGTLQSFWKFQPFHENAVQATDQQIVNVLAALAPGGDPAIRKQVLDQIEQWRDNPFDPHLLARIRITAYQKAVVIKYIQNLIAWGDQLFARDTIEEMNEATQLYVLASHILGRRPETAPQRGETDAKNYHELYPSLDGFSNAMVDLENEFPFSSIDAANSGSGGASVDMGVAKAFYFCIPGNDALDALWDTVADRLFKIRHCMNLQGVVRQLPLFEPPIDPALLVRAAALGLDIGAVLDDISTPLAPYRFTTLAQKATELAGEVRGLGAALLAALEKRDGEALAVLRAGQETALLKAIADLKQRALDEANTNLDALQRTRELTVTRQTYYEQLINIGLNPAEATQLLQLGIANQKTLDSIGYEQEAQGASQIPNATAGTSGVASPVVTAQFGGSNVAAALTAYGRYISGQGTTAAYVANANSVMAGHQRRSQEWQQQLTLATKELDQIDKQIAAAGIRIAMAQVDHDNQVLQIENSEAVGEFLSSKYTNTNLYSWMQSQLATLYFQLYGIAYDVAKKAEKAFRFELGLTSSSYIQFGYWDSLHKGLLSGERLAVDVKRMEAAYVDQNRRELELAKDVSLLQLDPLQLVQLRTTGNCEIELSEVLFDGDYPGHYMRRCKQVAVTIPCVVGPYTSINCTITQLSSRVRSDPNAQRPYAEDADKPDPRFTSSFGALQSIATSHGQNDSGLFELNFRDERYLPFEGSGAISRWRIDLPIDSNAFDLDTISDVILHVRYTARDGGAALKKAATAARATALAAIDGDLPLARMFSARQEFPNEWHRFLFPVDAALDLDLTLDLSQSRFPFAFRDTATTPKKNRIHFTTIDLILTLKESTPYINATPGGVRFNLLEAGVAVATADLASPPTGGPPRALQVSVGATAHPDVWTARIAAADLASLATTNPALCKTITVDGNPRLRLDAAAIEDLQVVCHYTLH